MHYVDSATDAPGKKNPVLIRDPDDKCPACGRSHRIESKMKKDGMHQKCGSCGYQWVVLTHEEAERHVKEGLLETVMGAGGLAHVPAGGLGRPQAWHITRDEHGPGPWQNLPWSQRPGRFRKTRAALGATGRGAWASTKWGMKRLFVVGSAFTAGHMWGDETVSAGFQFAAKWGPVLWGLLS